jgi:hypothetical protein
LVEIIRILRTTSAAAIGGFHLVGHTGQQLVGDGELVCRERLSHRVAGHGENALRKSKGRLWADRFAVFPNRGYTTEAQRGT